MIYITGDTHNTIDMRHLSAKWMRRYCFLQGAKYSEVTEAIVLGDFGLPWEDCPVDENGIHPVEKATNTFWTGTTKSPSRFWP